MERTEGNITVVEKLFTAFSARHIADTTSTLAEDVTWEADLGSPNAGFHRGIGEVKTMLESAWERFPEGLAIHGLTLHAGGDRVFAELRMDASNRSEKVSSRTLMVFQLGFGKITAIRQYVMNRPSGE